MAMININGIRLAREMIEVRQNYSLTENTDDLPAYKRLSDHRINMVCVGIQAFDHENSFSCCLDRDQEKVMTKEGDPFPGTSLTRVRTISVYPHHASVKILGTLLELLGRAQVRLRHLVSSTAMVSLIVSNQDQHRVVSLLQKGFSLPESHTPLIQELDQDISQLLKKYPETRAFYVEEKIKTYGINLVPGLDLVRSKSDHMGLCQWGKAIQSLETVNGKFSFSSVLPCSGNHKNDSAPRFDLAFVIPPLSAKEKQCFKDREEKWGKTMDDPVPCDLIFFHGPHFGDRYRIFNTAMTCLDSGQVPVLVAGCTGASITLVLPAGMGGKGKQVLERGFEAP